MHRALRSILVASLLAAGLLLGGTDPAAASTCILPVRGTTPTAPVTVTWATTSPVNNRQICFNMAIDGRKGDRYYRIWFDAQDLIDTGSGADKWGLCVQYQTPGTSVWHSAACDQNSADFVKNNGGADVSLVVDSWATGPSCGFRGRVIASDAAHPGGAIWAGPAKLPACWN